MRRAARQTPSEQKMAAEEETALAKDKALVERLKLNPTGWTGWRPRATPTSEELAEDWRRWMEAVPPNS